MMTTTFPLSLSTRRGAAPPLPNLPPETDGAGEVGARSGTSARRGCYERFVMTTTLPLSLMRAVMSQLTMLTMMAPRKADQNPAT